MTSTAKSIQKLCNSVLILDALWPLKRGWIKKKWKHFISPFNQLFKSYLVRDFFWFDIILEARAEIFIKFLLLFFVDLKTPKGHFEINWPLASSLFLCLLTFNKKVRLCTGVEHERQPVRIILFCILIGYWLGPCKYVAVCSLLYVLALCGLASCAL